MLMSTLFGHTLRDAPSDASTPSHSLLVRAGMIQQLGSGIYSYLPLAWRALEKIERILANELEAIGGQRISMPVIHPADAWKASGRWSSVGEEMVRFKDRQNHDMVLAMTHEEIVATLVCQHVKSYRDLPVMVYQIQTKFRDEPRSRGGLIRVREFVMKDAYSLHTQSENVDEFYKPMYEAYIRSFRKCGIETLAVESDSGMMGGTIAHEFILATPTGEDTVLVCPNGDYAANLEVATRKAETSNPAQDQINILEEVATPNHQSIDEVAKFLNITNCQTLKSVFYKTKDRLILVAIRGDLEVNETKLAKILKCTPEPASKKDLASADIIAGYASPVGLDDIFVVADISATTTINLVGGANKHGFHLKNLNYGRDFIADTVADISSVKSGDPCPRCGHLMHACRGIELGNIFNLGPSYCEKAGAYYLDADGNQQPVVMASYGIGVGRLLASVIERHHDQNGIIFPATISPYDVHIVQIGQQPEIVAAAEQLHTQLESDGLTVLRDDRAESAGVKFKDSDLIGIPIRATISTRNLKLDQIELKLRHSDEPEHVALSAASHHIQNLHSRLIAKLDPEVPLWDAASDAIAQFS